jgi:urease accessory protein
MNRPSRQAVLLFATLLPLVAQAHPGHEAHAGFMQGVLHPLTGWDHLFVLLSLGVLAAMRGVRVATFCGGLLAMALMGGAALGLRNPELPLIESAIFFTVLLCAVLLVLRRFIHSGVLTLLCLSFTFVHGVAHGQEAPVGDIAAYFAGFTASAVTLYVIAATFTLHRLRRIRGAALSRS